MTNNQRAMYTGLCLCRSTEVGQRWARTQAFLLIHSATLTFTATRPQPTLSLLLSMSIFGLALVGIWFLANRRTDQWITYWESQLAVLEQAEPELVETPVFRGPAWQQITGARLTFNFIVNSLIVVLALMWSTVFVRAFLV